MENEQKPKITRGTVLSENVAVNLYDDDTLRFEARQDREVAEYRWARDSFELTCAEVRQLMLFLAEMI